jgi:hypothetical protein
MAGRKGKTTQARHVLSVRLMPQLYEKLKAVSEATGEPINVLLNRYARDALGLSDADALEVRHEPARGMARSRRRSKAEGVDFDNS